jgi:hypothetical protein
MNEDEWFGRLRNDARSLGYAPPEPWLLDRLVRGVFGRIEARSTPSVFAFLSAWLRPIGIAAALVAVLGAAAALMTLRADEPLPEVSAQILMLEEVSYGAAE